MRRRTRTGKDDKEIVLDAGPHIKFYLTAGEAEADQFQGDGEGAEQIGGALLYVATAATELRRPPEAPQGGRGLPRGETS